MLHASLTDFRKNGSVFVHLCVFDDDTLVATFILDYALLDQASGARYDEYAAKKNRAYQRDFR